MLVHTSCLYIKKYPTGCQNKGIYQFTRYSFSNKNQSDVSESEKKKRKLNRTTIYRGRDRITLTGELDLFDDGNILSKK